jgi:Carboxypeptidase regulatory-like domain
MRRSLLVASCVCLLFRAPDVWGQAAESGSIVGTVVDPQGAAIQNVKVTLTSPALQVPQLTAVTDAEGSYKFVNLPAPGVYRATFEKEESRLSCGPTSILPLVSLPLKEKWLFEPNFQVFNLLNTSAAVTTSHALTTFGAVSNIVSPRVLRIGGLFSF